MLRIRKYRVASWPGRRDHLGQVATLSPWIQRCRTPSPPEKLEELAGAAVFSRGEKLIDMAGIEENSAHRLSGTVQGSQVDRVEFLFSAGRIQAGCTCPHFARGNICKHLVALGLATGEGPGVSFDDPAEESAETTYLLNAERGELLRLVDYTRALSPEFADYLRQQVTVQEGSDKDIEAHVREAITQAGRVGSFVSYDRAQDVAEELGRVAQLIAGYAAAGRSRALIRQSRRLVGRTAKIMGRADDSFGLIGDVLFEAVALHTRVCLDAPADPGKLVDWILETQVSGPGWPELKVSGYQSILDDKARPGTAVAWKSRWQRMRRGGPAGPCAATWSSSPTWRAISTRP